MDELTTVTEFEAAAFAKMPRDFFMYMASTRFERPYVRVINVGQQRDAVGIVYLNSIVSSRAAPRAERQPTRAACFR